MENRVYCPLIDEEIEDIECIENVDCVIGIQKENSIPARYRKKENWKDICKKCKHHNE